MIIPGMDPFPCHGIARLDHLGVIRASGADAAAFLQGQLTNDVLTLGGDRARLAGWCSPKGRLLASFVVWRDEGSGDLLLGCARDLLAPTLKRLSMFVLRAKCRLSEATADVALFGAAGEAATALVGDVPPWARVESAGITAIRLPDGAGTSRALVVGTADAPSPAGDPLSLDAWRWLEVESGIVAVEAATVDRFVPQMANHELVGAVDFRKGCFPGQEVVARSQYRGTTKRRTFLYETADAGALPGTDVHDPAQPNEPAGTVAMAAPHPAGRGGSVLVELRLASHGSTDLRLGSIDGPRLVERPLPYAALLEPADPTAPLPQ